MHESGKTFIGLRDRGMVMNKKIDTELIRQYRENWEPIVTDGFSEINKEIYKNRKYAVDAYIDGVSLPDILERTHIIPNEVLRLVKKCCMETEDNHMLGYVALIPHYRNKRKKNKVEMLCEKYSGLADFIEGNYFGDKRYTLEKNMTMKNLHKKFVDYCKELGIPDYEFPFTTKDRGYQTLINYIKMIRNANSSLAISREDPNAIQKFNSTGNGTQISIKPYFPFQTVQLDGHRIDLLYTIEVEDHTGQIIKIPATRLWVIAVIDVATRAVLGYSVSARENYDHFSVLEAIKNSILPHKSLSLPYDLKYPDNGGYPSTAYTETEWAIFDTIMLDNAKSHLAHDVIHTLTEELGCCMNFGSVATPESRGVVERLFGTIEKNGFHRLPSTTGSNVQDKKRNHPEKNAIKYDITFDDVTGILDYLFALYNNSSHSGIDGFTPLEKMGKLIRESGMMPNIIEDENREKIKQLCWFNINRKLRGGYETGRRPILSYQNIHYHAKGCKLDMSLVGQNVIIRVNPDDISRVRLYSKEGIYLADMVADGEWGSKPHSLKTREYIMKHKGTNANSSDSFMPDLRNIEHELRKKAKKSRRTATAVSIMNREAALKQCKPEISKEKHIPSSSFQEELAAASDYMELRKTKSIREMFEEGMFE